VKVTPSLSDLKAIQSANKNLILHNNDLLWNVSNVKIEDGFLSGTVYKIYPERYDFINNYRESHRYRRRENVDQSYIINEIHLYAKDQLTVRDSVKIPLEMIWKIEIFDKDKSSTDASLIISLLGIATLVTIVATTVFSPDFMF